jgi:hypothetical protein
MVAFKTYVKDSALSGTLESPNTPRSVAPLWLLT